MSVLTWPAGVLPKKVKFQIIANTQSFSSPLSGAVQTLEHPGAKWHVSMSFSFGYSLRHQARAFAAFLVALRGRAGRFTLGDFGHPVNFGTCLGTPVVSGADQTGADLVTSGWTASQSGLLLPGDYVQVGEKFKMVSGRVDSDGDGVATLPVEPPIYVAPSDGASIITASPVGIFMLVDDDQASWDVTSPLRHEFVIEAEEALI